jgi:hypothetical protein
MANAATKRGNLGPASCREAETGVFRAFKRSSMKKSPRGSYAQGFGPDKPLMRNVETMGSTALPDESHSSGLTSIC